MAQIVAGVSRTFNEYLLLPNRTAVGCAPDAVDLRTPLVRHREGAVSAIELGSPFTSAIMQAVGSPDLAIALARNGGLSFLHHNQPIDEQAADVRKVRTSKRASAPVPRTYGHEAGATPTSSWTRTSAYVSVRA